jgi:hypothetical protein
MPLVAQAIDYPARVTGTTPTFNENENRQLSMDKSGNTRVIISGGGANATATATAAAPTYVEGSTTSPLSLDLSGNLRTTLGTLLSGEDQTNNLIQTSGGAVRQTVLVSAVTTNTTSAAQIVPVGVKGFYGQVVGTGAVTQTQALYCDVDSDAANGILLGTLTLSGTTRDQALIPRTDLPCSYVYVVTTATTGTSAAGALYAMY